MPLVPVTNKWGRIRRERILVYGGPKVGKSHLVLDMAQWYESTGTGGIFYYIDTDATLDTIDDQSQFSALNNIIPYIVNGWEEIYQAGREIQKLAGEGDWVVIDMAHRPWDELQAWYLGYKYGTDELAKKMIDLKWSGSKSFGDNPLIEKDDWGPINKSYREFFNPLALTSRAHLLCVTEQTGIYAGPGADKEKTRTYDKIGFKPAGQKSLDYLVSTILYMDKTSFGRYVTSAGERGGREWLEQAPFDNLVQSYLVPVGKWSLS